MKKLKELIESVNLNFKVEIAISISSFILCICASVILFILKQQNYAIGVLAVPMVVIIFQYWRINSLKDKQRIARQDEFINLVNYLEIFLSNKYNVYNSFMAIKKFSSPWMSEKIENLLNEIDKDKTVSPFINFANNFSVPFIENVMVSIYQMIEEGENANQLNQFDILFQRFSENHHLANINKKVRQMDSLAIFPLIGAGLVTIILTFSILTIMEDIINVI